MKRREDEDDAVFLAKKHVTTKHTTMSFPYILQCLSLNCVTNAAAAAPLLLLSLLL